MKRLLGKNLIFNLKKYLKNKYWLDFSRGQENEDVKWSEKQLNLEYKNCSNR